MPIEKSPFGMSRSSTTTTTNGNQSEAWVLIRLFAASSSTPRISPPTIAPTGRSVPPIISATKPAMPYVSPRYGFA